MSKMYWKSMCTVFLFVCLSGCSFVSKETKSENENEIKLETEGYTYIDEQGYIIEYSTEQLQIPTIIGMNINPNDIKNQHRLDQNDLEKMESILQIYEQFKNFNMEDKITQIQVKDEFIVSLINEGITVNFGDATNLKNKMYYVNGIFKQESGNRGTIFVNGNLNEGFSPYFKAE